MDFLNYAKKSNFELTLHLYHEILVLRAKQQLREYIICYGATGMLGCWTKGREICNVACVAELLEAGVVVGMVVYLGETEVFRALMAFSLSLSVPYVLESMIRGHGSLKGLALVSLYGHF